MDNHTAVPRDDIQSDYGFVTSFAMKQFQRCPTGRINVNPMVLSFNPEGAFIHMQ